MKISIVKNSARYTVVFIALIATPVLAEIAATGTYKIDPIHTSVQFSVNHLGASNLVGRFNNVAGNIRLNPQGDSMVNVTIQTNSVDTNYPKRDMHLRSPDFFNAKQYPVIKFISDKVNYKANGDPASVTGKLNMHGKTQGVTFIIKPVGAGKDPWGGYRAGYEATTTIKRSAFGMNFMPSGIGDDVNITLNIETIKQ